MVVMVTLRALRHVISAAIGEHGKAVSVLPRTHPADSWVVVCPDSRTDLADPSPTRPLVECIVGYTNFTKFLDTPRRSVQGQMALFVEPPECRPNGAEPTGHLRKTEVRPEIIRNWHNSRWVLSPWPEGGGYVTPCVCGRNALGQQQEGQCKRGPRVRCCAAPWTNGSWPRGRGPRIRWCAAPWTNGQAAVVRVPKPAQPPRLMAQRTWSACQMSRSPQE